MFRRIPRLLKRILLWTGAGVAVCLIALITLAYIYQDEVKARLIAELNAHLLVPVKQNGIELTLLRRFPQASLRFRDVEVAELRTDSARADTLLYARDLYLEFGLISLLRGDFTISRVHGEDVRLNPGLDRHGTRNWLIWRTDSTSQGGADLALEKISFDGLRATYHDDRSGLRVAVHSDRSTLQGRFRPDGSTLSIAGDILLERWVQRGATVLSDRQADVRLDLAFGGPDGAFEVRKGSEVLTGGTPLAVTLAVADNAKGRSLDLRANGFNMGLGDLVALLPEGLNARLRHYDLSGTADVAIHYAGPLDGPGPALSVGLSVRDGRLKESSSGALFKNVRGDLALDLSPDGTPRRITVKGLQAHCASGSLGGDLTLTGLRNAPLKADLHADLALADLLRFARIDTLEEATGRLKVNVRASGAVRDVAHWKAADLRTLAIEGTADLADASLKMRGIRHRLTGLQADLAVKGADATVHGLRCELQGNAIELSGTLRNLVPYLLFPDQHLTIEAQGRSPHLDLASLFATGSATNTTSVAYAVKLPAYIDLDLRAAVDELVFEDFAAQHIQGTVTLKDRVLVVEPLSFTSAQGSVQGALKLDGRGTNAYPLAINAGVHGMDITALFHEFRNFGQTFITDHHLKGTSDLQLVLTADLTPGLRLDQNSLHCVANVTIDNGQLNDHAPMMAVADYLRSNKLINPFVDTEELKRRLAHVTFARLEDQVEIKDRTVYIPTMLVKSSAMDIEVSAAQTFDGGVDDHLNFRLGDLFKLGDEQQDEFGPVVDDGTGIRIFLRMYGTTQDLRFGNDGAMAAARRKARLKQETAELKGILSDIWHGKGGPGDGTGTAPAPVFQVQTDADSTGAAARTPPKRKSGLGLLLSGSGKEEAPEERITVE